MRQHGVNRQGGKRIVGISQLFDQPHAINDHLRPDAQHYPGERIVVKEIDTGQEARLGGLRGEISPPPFTTHCPPDIMLLIFGKHPQYSIAQHPGYTQHQHSHQLLPPIGVIRCSKISTKRRACRCISKCSRK